MKKHLSKHVTRHKERVKSYFIFTLLVVVFSFTLSQVIYLAAATYTIGPNSINPNTIDTSQHNSLQLKTFGLQSKCIADMKTISSEPAILWAVSPGPGESAGQGGKIKVWYNDKWPITLGSAASGISINLNGHLTNPDVGDTTARDHFGLPYFPAIFISDITYNPNNMSGDAENGGAAYKPDEVWGGWKPSGTPNWAGYGQGNYLQLPPGADPFPTQSNLKQPVIFDRPREWFNGTELIWNVDNLKLTTGHAYRVQIVLHDGDQYYGGDLGIGCSTIQM